MVGGMTTNLDTMPSGFREPQCPSWCVGHGAGRQPWETTSWGQDREHGGDSVRVGGASVSVLQLEHEDHTMAPAVVGLFDAEDLLLSEVDAHELGLALVRAADRIRRERGRA